MASSMSEQSEQQKIDRGREAERLLNNELLLDALARIENDVIEAWANIPVRDTAGAQELTRLIKTTRKFKVMLKVYLDSGKYTATQLAESEKEKNRLMERVSRYIRR
jgi:hypothetical protein